MKILVVGNAGFIGSFLTRRLAENGYEVVGMDINPNGHKENLSNFILGNIQEPEEIIKAAQGVDVIINLAAKHHDFGVSRDEFFGVNVQGTQNILDCASQLGIKKVVFYSTVAVYGNIKSYTTENTATNPVSNYGKSKLAAEKLVCAWTTQDRSREAIIIRPTVVFGPTNYANMYNLIDKIYKKKFIFVGKGNNIKSVAYVENLVQATIFLIERMHPGIEIYNYSDYPQMTIEQTVVNITRNIPHNIPKVKIPLRPTLALASVIDLLEKITGYNFPITANRIKKFNTQTHHNSDKIRNIGFEPPIALSEGVRKTVKWYLENRNNHKKVGEGNGEE